MKLEHVYFFEGIDPAPSESHKSDDGALIAGCAKPRRLPEKDEPLSDNPADWYFDFIYGRRMTWKQKASARQWAGIIHQHHQRFRFERICMDPNGGGTLIKRELISTRQLINGVDTDVTPIGDQVDGPHLVGRGDFILHIFKRGDPGVEALWPELPGDDNLNDALYSVCKDAVDHGLWAWPMPIEEWLVERKDDVGQWPEERVWALKNLDAATVQMKNIVVATKEDGTFAFTKRNARQFSSIGKKDFVSASMYCYAAFLMWLRSDDWRSRVAPEDANQFSGWGGSG
jgi:hypothetical protein